MSDSNMMSKVAAHAPEHYAYLLKTAEEVKQSPFRDDIITELQGIMEKAAAWAGPSAEDTADAAKAAWKSRAAEAAKDVPWKKGVQFVGAAAAAGVAMSIGGDMYEAVKRGLTKGRHYKAMLEENPDLRDKAGIPFVKRHFNTLHKFNPEYASDPNVAGSYVRQNMQLQSDDISAIHALVKARRDIQGARELRAMPAFGAPRM